MIGEAPANVNHSLLNYKKTRAPELIYYIISEISSGEESVT